SILGDRTRVILPPRENRIFFRSQASQLEMGGVNPYTYHVIRLLRHLFDYVIIETVGIGQNETEVTNLADFSFLVMQPLGGDQIQFMKSGIMEVPDAFIINKCDEKELASASYHTLLASLEFLHDTLNQKEVPDIFLSSVTKNLGIEELMAYILTITHKKSRKEEMLHQLKRWIRNEYGNLGLKYFTPFYSNRENASFETLEADFNKHFLSLFHSY
ncbi:MAG: protein kinase, partial [Leptospiraceae bacterium]|nr:protein kinase [Leptospiraceae bacterium]